MENSIIKPVPPALAGFTWGPIGREDLDALVDLAGTCFRADGGIHWMFEPDELTRRFFPEEPGGAIGVLDADGKLVACNTVHLSGRSDKQRAVIVGFVHPDMRGRGFGTYLMDWSQVQARNLLAGADADQRVLMIHTESLTEPAHHLYLAHGFQSVFEQLVMKRDLRLPLPDRPLPSGAIITDWRPDLADQFFQAYQGAFRERPDFPGYSADQWITRVTENDHKPEWSLLAYMDGMPAGFVIGNIELGLDPPGSHIWQIGVVPAQRRRRLASALLVETMRRMQAAGIVSARLEVHVNNPGAIQTYTDLGFVTTGCRARYERIGE